MSEIKIKRIYLQAENGDGFRIFVDRLWARGLSKEAADILMWKKEIAPTSQLRKWFDHIPEKFEEFSEKYIGELSENRTALNFVAECIELLKRDSVTLLYAAKDTQYNHAVVLKKWLMQKISERE